jgi:prepilin-type N-terminal cleavage/methylation domain-containing protein
MNPPSKNPAKAFSLLELLVVMAIIVVMSSLAGPAMNAIRGGGDFNMAAYNISDALQQARAYAMAKNTFVYFGIKEVDANKDTLDDGTGSLAVAIVASKSGERPYGQNPAALSNDPTAANAIIPISRLQKFSNTHLADALSSDGGMADRETSQSQVVSIASKDAATSFMWPVGAASGKEFKHVIEFDPQGVARVQTASTTNVRSIKGWIEIPLQRSHGSAGAGASEKNQAAIQVDGMTGAVRVFRP